MGSSEGQWEAVGMGDGTFRGPITGSHTSVPGLALSRPYHCTSASSEHSGLLRKQLSLKDLEEEEEEEAQIITRIYHSIIYIDTNIF